MLFDRLFFFGGGGGHIHAAKYFQHDANSERNIMAWTWLQMQWPGMTFCHIHLKGHYTRMLN